MDPIRRQLTIRVINGIEENEKYAKKLGIEDVSTYRGKKVKRKGQ